ncbi:MAG: hypothetical protein ABIT71_22965 [Vicinamibacteraceae bacterium]
MAARRQTPRLRIAADAQVDPVARGARRAVDDREVILVDGAPRHRPGQRRVDGGRLGDQHDAGRLAIEAVDEVDAPAAPRVRQMREQRVHQRAGWIPARRMHDQAGRLVDGQQRVVFIEDRERPGFGDMPARLELRQVERDRLAEAEALRRPRRRHAIDLDAPLADPRREPRPRQPGRVGQARHEQPIQPLPDLAAIDFEDAPHVSGRGPPMTPRLTRTGPERSGYSGQPRRAFGAPEGP